MKLGNLKLLMLSQYKNPYPMPFASTKFTIDIFGIDRQLEKVKQKENREIFTPLLKIFIYCKISPPSL